MRNKLKIQLAQSTIQLVGFAFCCYAFADVNKHFYDLRMALFIVTVCYTSFAWCSYKIGKIVGLCMLLGSIYSLVKQSMGLGIIYTISDWLIGGIIISFLLIYLIIFAVRNAEPNREYRSIDFQRHCGDDNPTSSYFWD